jgi:RNA polymerase sigma-70 factor (ECF subfamily)
MRKAKVEDLACSASTDHALLGRFRVGEQDAATELYLRYAGRLQAWASSQTSSALKTRFDPEDVVQSVFRTLFRRVGEGLYDVPPGEELWQLLLVLALNKIRKLATYHHAQKRDVGKTFGSATLDHIHEQRANSDETSLQILQMVVDELLCDMPAANRRIVELRIEGYRVPAIAQRAQRSQRSQRTVERVLQDFRLKLSALIDAGTHVE